ncbi:VRR-NUC domain-containing protein [Nesterenkonia lacusekhoensis]|uniref:VRR-NUC domain-containing protein n=1 Tax=Nesterenkonia lacusekhoensis TaxID=150832 RepID=A0ABS4T5Z3_9MICC|nr:VRR-NUC domain-containing protein [Nesterenkonia lacusekhoensis]MBP2319580.1 hypothetical protein [Nesterenkonia lacusekhoensis]
MPTTTAADWRLEQISKWPEKTFQQQVINLARQLGWWVYHTYRSDRSTPGFPDLYMAHPEHGILLRELKTEKGRISPAQRDAMAVIEKAGGDVAVWRPRHWASREIHEALNPGGRNW